MGTGARLVHGDVLLVLDVFGHLPLALGALGGRRLARAVKPGVERAPHVWVVSEHRATLAAIVQDDGKLVRDDGTAKRVRHVCVWGRHVASAVGKWRKCYNCIGRQSGSIGGAAAETP